MLKSAIELWKRGKNKNGISLQRRLFAFFASATIFVVLLFTALLLLLGAFGNSEKVICDYVGSELSHIEKTIEKDFGKLSVQGVLFSEKIGKNIDLYLSENGLLQDSLKKQPSHLTPILEEQMDSVLEIMNKNTCTGAFILLEATVNPNAPNAQNSKAGIFVKNTHPNSVDTVHSKLHYLRGPADIARTRGIELLGQWKMEYDTENQPFWNDVMQKATDNKDLPLSRLFYWTGCVNLKGTSETGILLCVPIRGSSGTVYGVCGIEVSDMLFKQKYTPNDSVYKNVFTLISPASNDILYSENGLIAGNYFLTFEKIEKSLKVNDCKSGLCYFSNESDTYGGIHNKLKLYPDDSPYKENVWEVLVMMPKSAIDSTKHKGQNIIFLIVLLLLTVSIIVSIFISRKYLKPITEALDSIKEKNYKSENVYMEINDLMEFLIKQEATVKNQPEKADTFSMFESFLINLKTLSKAERMVFDEYLEGLKAQEIADKLNLSINTIKTHNRRLFAKLNVSTRKELMVYVDMMKEKNLIDRSDKH